MGGRYIRERRLPRLHDRGVAPQAGVPTFQDNVVDALIGRDVQTQLDLAILGGLVALPEFLRLCQVERDGLFLLHGRRRTDHFDQHQVQISVRGVAVLGERRFQFENGAVKTRGRSVGYIEAQVVAIVRSQLDAAVPLGGNGLPGQATEGL